jgi:hypothetical protein
VDLEPVLKSSERSWGIVSRSLLRLVAIRLRSHLNASKLMAQNNARVEAGRSASRNGHYAASDDPATPDIVSVRHNLPHMPSLGVSSLD